MFRCGITGKLSQLGEAQHKITMEKRDKDYSAWRENDDEDWEFVKVSSGWEIAREVSATEEGLKLWESWSPSQQEAFIKSSGQPSSEKIETKRRMAK